METTTIKVDGMSCGGCVKSVTGVLTALDGVAKAEVSLEHKQAVVEFDAGKVSRDQLKAVIEDAGFDAA
jgi:copper chaperone